MKGARWLICAERRKQVWRCELVLNAVFYWEPVEFFQKRCDMIMLRFFQDEPCGVVLDLLYANGLFIGFSCESSIAVVQSWRDHRRNELFCGTVTEERTDRGDSPECEKRSAAEATDVLFHWQCLIKMHSKVRNGGLKRNVTSICICRLAADRTDTHWWTYKHHLSFFCVKLQFVALHPWQSIAYTGLNVGLSRSEIARWCTVRDFCVISVLVIVTAVTCYDIRQGLWIQGL